MSDDDNTPVDLPYNPPRVIVTGNGPNLCYNTFVEVDGIIMENKDGKPIALCACGLSQNRPYCDGSHKILVKKPETEEE